MITVLSARLSTSLKPENLYAINIMRLRSVGTNSPRSRTPRSFTRRIVAHLLAAAHRFSRRQLTGRQSYRTTPLNVDVG